MNIYLISQSENGHYDTYDAAVVSAPDTETARNMNPRDGEPMTSEDWGQTWSSWASGPQYVTVKHLGETNDPQGVILASFKAG
jgi:hypothetical protein